MLPPLTWKAPEAFLTIILKGNTSLPENGHVFNAEFKGKEKNSKRVSVLPFFTPCVCTQVYIHMHVHGGQRTTLRTQYYKATVETSRNRTQVTKPKHKQFYLLSHFADLTFLLLLTFNFLISIQNTGLPSYMHPVCHSAGVCVWN